MEGNISRFTAINQVTTLTTPASALKASSPAHETSPNPARNTLLSIHLGLGKNDVPTALEEVSPKTGRFKKIRSTTSTVHHSKIAKSPRQPKARAASTGSYGLVTPTPTTERVPVKRKRFGQAAAFSEFVVTKSGLQLAASSKVQSRTMDLSGDSVPRVGEDPHASNIIEQDASHRFDAFQYQTPEPGASANPELLSTGAFLDEDADAHLFHHGHDMRNSFSASDFEDGLDAVLAANRGGDNVLGSDLLYEEDKSRAIAEHTFDEYLEGMPGEVGHEDMIMSKSTPYNTNIVQEQDDEAAMYGFDEDLYDAMNDMEPSTEQQIIEPTKTDSTDDLEDELDDDVLMHLLPDTPLAQKHQHPIDYLAALAQQEPSSPTQHLHETTLSTNAEDEDEDDWAFTDHEETHPFNPITPVKTPPTSTTTTSTTTSTSSPFRSTPKPITRPLFPRLTRDRSPITGLTPHPHLLTCFRLPEALNAGCAAARANVPGSSVLIELYARVLESERDVGTRVQRFLFGDLFWGGGGGGGNTGKEATGREKGKEVTLEATWEGWKGVGPWEFDGAALLEEGLEGGEASGRKEKVEGKTEGKGKGNKICRAIGRLRREGKTGGWKFIVANIWEAGWEDVEVVGGIVCS